ncbi:DUF4214 domain-containing protein [Marimonas sp. MJW-29]|uniref:DUF4214 domain-containing protein n=1 Tax=Sulfitobacter sediminis TaxID=3234186 RepID=A0ABV3RH17_9RHOB
MFPEDSPLLAALASYSADERVYTSAVTYRFMPGGSEIDDGDPATTNAVSVEWSAAEMQYVRDLFAYISTVANLSFAETTSSDATVSFYEVGSFADNTTGYVSFFEAGRSIAVIASQYTGPLADNDDNVTMIHEIGHALGLAHPHDGPAVLPGVGNQDDKGDLNLNTEFTTRMSYVPGESPLHPGLNIYGEANTFGAIDIAALQLLYGANTQTGLGDTVYGDTRNLVTIWDNGGTDRIDFSFATEAAAIDLRAATLAFEAGGGGYLSYVASQNGTVADGGYSIAYGVVIEEALGGAGNDRVTGNGADNLLSGNGGDDVIDGSGGNDILNGGAGRDTGVYSGNRESYTLTLSAQSMTLADRRGTDGTDTLTDIELLTFGDATIAPFDLTVFAGTAGLSEAQMKSFIELYIAYFNRAPDAVGLNFWGTAFANGTSLQQMATLFIDQDETRATYAADLSNSAFATAVYTNVLGRVADQAGFDFWVGVLDSGAVGRDQFILNVLEGAKAAPPQGATQDFIDQQAADRAYLSSKTDIGAYFAVIRGMSNVDNARGAMGGFDGSAGSINSVVQAIDGYFASAQAATGGEFLMPLVGVLDDPFAAMA